MYFADGEFKALTNGRVIGKDDWLGAANGVGIDYHQANVSFEIDGDIIRVKASGCGHRRGATQIAEYAEYLVPGGAYGYRHPWVDAGLPDGSAANWDTI